jgi:hypothetical protein
VVVAAATIAIDRSSIEVALTDDRSGRVLWHLVVPVGASVELRYTHSVERTPVVEVFQAGPDGLWLTAMRFVSQGAGLPTEGYVREGDHFILRTRRHLGIVRLRVSALASQRLVVGKNQVDLATVAGDGAGVSLGSHRRLRVRWPARLQSPVVY